MHSTYIVTNHSTHSPFSKKNTLVLKEKSSVAEQGVVRLSNQVTVAYWARSLGARLSELCPEATVLFRSTTQFRSSKLSSEAQI